MNMNARDRFIDVHLPELSQEVLAWKKTGVLVGGRLQELAHTHYAFVGDDKLHLAEDAVKIAVMRAFSAKR